MTAITVGLALRAGTKGLPLRLEAALALLHFFYWSIVVIGVLVFNYYGAGNVFGTLFFLPHGLLLFRALLGLVSASKNGITTKGLQHWKRIKQWMQGSLRIHLFHHTAVATLSCKRRNYVPINIDIL